MRREQKSAARSPADALLLRLACHESTEWEKVRDTDLTPSSGLRGERLPKGNRQRRTALSARWAERNNRGRRLFVTGNFVIYRAIWVKQNPACKKNSRPA